MAFKVGDRVVYPHHGAAVIEKKETREVFGEKTEYFVLKVAHGDLTLAVPADKAEEVGMRPPISADDVDDLFHLLSKKDVREPTNWSRRFKNHQEKLKSGDVYQVAEVVRNLALREVTKGLSAGEKAMLVQGPRHPRFRAELRPRRLRGRGARAARAPAHLIPASTAAASAVRGGAFSRAIRFATRRAPRSRACRVPDTGPPTRSRR